MPQSGGVGACVHRESTTAQTVNEYGIAFLNRYLNGKNEPILDRSGTELADYRHYDH